MVHLTANLEEAKVGIFEEIVGKGLEKSSIVFSEIWHVLQNALGVSMVVFIKDAPMVFAIISVVNIELETRIEARDSIAYFANRKVKADERVLLTQKRSH